MPPVINPLESGLTNPRDAKPALLGAVPQYESQSAVLSSLAQWDLSRVAQLTCHGLPPKDTRRWQGKGCVTPVETDKHSCSLLCRARTFTSAWARCRLLDSSPVGRHRQGEPST